MMKKNLIIVLCIVLGAAVTSCDHVKRTPGRVYMPDMNYSRAYETYSSTEALQKEGVFYNARPVEGTIARGDFFPYTLKNDSAGYAAAALIKNPLNVDSIDIKEAERLYLVNCAICHGPKLDGQGPLFASGVYPVAPKNFMADDVKKMAEGTMFHSVTYGKNMMGSYASQLSTKQRWMVIAYIKSKQNATASVAKADSTGTKK